MTKLVSRSIRAGILLCSAIGAHAAAPPRPGELEKYAADGTLEDRIATYQESGNDRFDKYLLTRAAARLQQRRLFATGLSAEEVSIEAPLPPPAWRGLPTTGDNAVVALLVEFADHKHTPANSRDAMHRGILGDGVPADRPYESVASYYRRASLGKLTITGETLGWYATAYAREDVKTTVAGREKLVKEVVRHFDDAGHDFSQYDNDNDGDIDDLVIIYAGPHEGWGKFWWAWQHTFQDASFKVDGKRIYTYVFQFQSEQPGGAFSPRVLIHETGHALGLPDYYDHKDAGPKGGLGGLDMMDSNLGDHNAFSKWILEWSTPKVVASGSVDVALRPASTSGDSVLVMPDAVENPFREYFLVENRTRWVQGNDDDANWPGNGLLIWHVDGTLKQDGQDYGFDNQATPHKLIRLMEADGKEEIESGNHFGDKEDFYAAGQSFDARSKPNSASYKNARTGVFVRRIRTTTDGMAATVGVETTEPVALPVDAAAFSLREE